MIDSDVGTGGASTVRDFSNPDVLLDIWNQTGSAADVTYHHYIATSEQLYIACFAYRSESLDCQLTLLLSGRPHIQDDFRAIKVVLGDRRRYSDREQWSLTFVLEDRGLRIAFAEICAALVRRLSRCSTWEQADAQISSVFVQFRRIVRLVSGSEALLRGTFAELAAMPVIADRMGVSLETAVLAWSGPYGAAQDYRFEEQKRAFEVKALLPSAHTVTISSPYQLDDAQFPSIELTTVRLTEVRAGAKGAMRLEDLVTWLVSQAHGDAGLTENRLNDGLENLGLQFLIDTLRERRYSVGDITVYAVKDDFPRVIADQVAPGVENLSYKLDLSTPQIQRYKVKRYEGLVAA
jgi:hypothetical protein